MSENSITADPAIADHAAALSTTVARPKPKIGRKAQDRRRARIVIAGVLVLVALGLLLAMATHYPMSPHATNAMSGGESHTGKVVSYFGKDKECRQQVFDNETGRVMKSEPCDWSVLDSDGASAVSSPRNRLDAISKTFSGR
jgi:hypothetical protein